MIICIKQEVADSRNAKGHDEAVGDDLPTRSVIHCCKGYSGRQPGFQNASVANCHCKSAPAWVDRIRRSAPSGLATKMERTASRWRRDYSLADRGPDGRVAIA